MFVNLHMHDIILSYFWNNEHSFIVLNLNLLQHMCFEIMNYGGKVY